MKLYITAASSVGCVRQNNEDMVLVSGAFVRDTEYQAIIDTTQRDRLLLALADGMGGHNGGEVASSDTLHNLQYFYGDLPTGLSSEQLIDKMRRWQESMSMIIDSKSSTRPELSGMGTTLVALVSYNHKYYWLNCGDSRLYRLHEGVLEQLTTDHSLEAITGREEHANILTNCIGGGCKDNFLDMQPITAYMLPGDTYMLCSDGLYNMLDNVVLAKLLRGRATASQLCDEACRAGGLDNVSCCVVRVEW